MYWIIQFLSVGISYYYVVVAVRFNQSSYSISESSRSVQLLLILSNPSSFNETVSLINTDHTANGMYMMITAVYTYIYIYIYIYISKTSKLLNSFW